MTKEWTNKTVYIPMNLDEPSGYSLEDGDPLPEVDLNKLMATDIFQDTLDELRTSIPERMKMNQLNNLMATEVMGWERYNYAEKYWYADNDTGPVYDFSPTTDMNQAMECVKEFDEGDGWLYAEISLGECNIVDAMENHIKFSESGELTPQGTALAICKAIAKAKGIDT